jgi:hypothetical protein
MVTRAHDPAYQSSGDYMAKAGRDRPIQGLVDASAVNSDNVTRDYDRPLPAPDGAPPETS